MNLNTQHLNSQNSALFTRKLPRFPLFVWRLGVVNPKCIPFLTLSSAVCVFFCRHCRADLMVRHITFWTPPFFYWESSKTSVFWHCCDNHCSVALQHNHVFVSKKQKKTKQLKLLLQNIRAPYVSTNCTGYKIPPLFFLLTWSLKCLLLSVSCGIMFDVLLWGFQLLHSPLDSV